MHSLHSAESMSYACSLIVSYPTPNFQWPMIALSLILFKSCFVPNYPFALAFLSMSCSIPGSCLVPVCSCSHSTYILFHFNVFFDFYVKLARIMFYKSCPFLDFCLVSISFFSHVKLGQCVKILMSSDYTMLVSLHLRLVQYFLCNVYIHVNQASQVELSLHLRLFSVVGHSHCTQWYSIQIAEHIVELRGM